MLLPREYEKQLAECRAATLHVLLAIERHNGEWTAIPLDPLSTPRSGE
jgi:hypothetical protein